MLNYKNIGFRCGIEVHQQLETHKLFCSCPTIENSKGLTIKRKLRAVTSELGEVDVAAMYEVAKGKWFIYESSPHNSCLVELDEEPPHSLNIEAFDTVLMVAFLLKAKVLDYAQIMRKTVIDGSNTSGFQRTMLVAVNGKLETSRGAVAIETICLEEEAAKRLDDNQNETKYSLDRLGIPLIEIATDDSIKGAEHAKEVAELLGMILRSTARVKRGIGTIRQDINISIKNSSRVELKGFQDLKSIPKVIENEISRLQNLKEHSPEVRKVEPDCSTSFLRPIPSAARMYPETDLALIKIDKNRLKIIKLPELISEKIVRLERTYNLPADLARSLIKSDIDFENFVKKFRNISPEIIAKALVEMPKEIKKRYKIDTKKIKPKDFEALLIHLNNGNVNIDAIFEMLVDVAKGHASSKINISKYKSVSDEELDKSITAIIEENKGASFNAIMGEIMKKYRGKVDGKKAAELIGKIIKQNSRT